MLRNTRLNPCLTFAWIFSSFIAPCAFAAPWCDSAYDLEPNTVWRGSAYQEQTFRWLLPSSGIATVDLLATGSEPAWIDFRSTTCDEQAADVIVIEQSATHLVLAVRSAGHLYLGTDAVATSFRLITSFTEAEVSEEAFDLGHPGVRAVQTSFRVASPVDKTEPEVSDPDPDGLKVGTRYVVASVLTLEGASSQKTEPEVSDPDPDGAPANKISTAGPARPSVLFFEPLCRRTELDDHGDTAICSTPLALGRTETGELTNDWQDDRDVFSFRLDKVSKVEIVLVAEGAGFAYALTGPAGQELAVDNLQVNDGADLRLVATLAPGRYFFRVTGTAGAYALNVTAYD